MSTVTQIGNESIDATIGRRVHTLMWERRMKNKQLAELLGLEPTGIGKKLRAEAKFSIDQLVKVAAILETSVAYLVGETEIPHPAGPNGGSESHLRESNPRPIHYMRQTSRPPMAHAS